MKKIFVSASTDYEVLVGKNLLGDAGKLIKEIAGACRAAIISDSHVWPLYGNVLEDSLHCCEIPTVSFVFPAGESSKNAETYLHILNFLAQAQLTRTDVIIALGGGVVGDMAGFAAATYLRGVSYVQIPTSLLAMVDSSVGGKTAIDLPAGKNLVGAFKQPRLVICDTATLNTLPEDYFLDGCAEIIKYGMLYDASLITYLSDTGAEFDREAVIAKCITFKRDVVAEDEFDTGSRQKLNLGHTIGHGIETGSNFTASHGCAVAAGMAIVTRAAAAAGLCEQTVLDNLTSLLSKFSLPTTTDLDISLLYSSALSDKKRAGGFINLIVPRAIGTCDILPISVDELKTFLKAGL